MYLILWLVWWSATFLGRRRGEATVYDKGQKLLVTLSGLFSVPFLILVPSWEYVHFSGSLVRDGFASWIGLSFFAMGILLQSIAMVQLGAAYTLRLGVSPRQELVATGAYRWIRHPGYLSNLLSIFGIGLSMSSVATLVFLVAIFLFIRIRIRSEEGMLLAEFGDSYRAYRVRTKMLVPFLY